MHVEIDDFPSGSQPPLWRRAGSRILMMLGILLTDIGALLAQMGKENRIMALVFIIAELVGGIILPPLTGIPRHVAWLMAIPIILGVTALAAIILLIVAIVGLYAYSLWDRAKKEKPPTPSNS